MSYLTEQEQIAKFWQDKIVQENINFLQTLIGKKSIFAHQIGLEEVADYLQVLFEEAGASVLVDKSYACLRLSLPNSWQIIPGSSNNHLSIITMILFHR